MQAEIKRGTAQQRSVELEITFPFLDVFCWCFFVCLFLLGFVGDLFVLKIFFVYLFLTQMGVGVTCLGPLSGECECLAQLGEPWKGRLSNASLHWEIRAPNWSLGERPSSEQLEWLLRSYVKKYLKDVLCPSLLLQVLYMHGPLFYSLPHL